MTDQEALEHLLKAHHPCISMVSQEEPYALEILHNAVMGSAQPLWIWSVVKGIYAGVFENSKPLPNTENPAAALYHFAYQLDEPCICAMLDLTEHLSDERTLRA